MPTLFRFFGLHQIIMKSRAKG